MKEITLTPNDKGASYKPARLPSHASTWFKNAINDTNAIVFTVILAINFMLVVAPDDIASIIFMYGLKCRDK